MSVLLWSVYSRLARCLWCCTTSAKFKSQQSSNTNSSFHKSGDGWVTSPSCYLVWCCYLWMEDTVVRAAKSKTCTGRVLQSFIGSAEPCMDDCINRCWLILLVAVMTQVRKCMLGCCLFLKKLSWSMRSKVSYRRVKIGVTFQSRDVHL